MSGKDSLFFYDLMGNEVRVGDTFVIASLNYRTPVLNLGLLKEIKLCNKVARVYYQAVGNSLFVKNTIYSIKTYFQLDKDIFLKENNSKDNKKIEWILKISDIEFHLNNERFSKLFEEKIKYAELDVKS
jgi:hypothetical protein